MKKQNSLLIALIFLAYPEISQAVATSEDLVQAGDLINGSTTQQQFKKTGRSWDFGIVGCGYFPLQDSVTGETYYTRLGRFELSRDGYVVLSVRPTLRLLVKSGDKVETLNMLSRLYLNGATMVGISNDEEKEVGVVTGVYSNGETVKVARLILTKFFNDGALTPKFPNIYRADVAALPSLFSPPEEKGLGSIQRGVLELL